MIKIVCVGKIKEKYLNELINDYLMRLRKYTKVEIVELKDSPIHKEEIDSILKVINKNDFNIALDLKGEMLDSIEFASLIDKTLIHNSNITFIIGPSLGLNNDIIKECNYVLSFSILTFPHGLFRGILLEQLYRCFKILNNESYHK